MVEAGAAAASVVPAFAGFGQELRAAGLQVGTGQVLSFCRGLAHLDPTDLRDVYWTGRACLVSRRADLADYDAAFARYFLGDANLEPPTSVTAHERRAAADDVGYVTSDVELLRDKDFAECDPDELDAIGRLMAGLVVATPMRRTRRTERARRGIRPDLRRALRAQIRRGGTVLPIPRRRPRVRPRRLVLLLDVSGSMSSYSRALLQFAYAPAGSCSCSTSRARCRPTHGPCSSSRTPSPADPRGSRCSASGPASRGSPAPSPAGTPIGRCARPPRPSSTGMAAPASGSPCTSTSGPGRGEARVGARSW